VQVVLARSEHQLVEGVERIAGTNATDQTSTSAEGSSCSQVGMVFLPLFQASLIVGIITSIGFSSHQAA